MATHTYARAHTHTQFAYLPALPSYSFKPNQLGLLSRPKHAQTWHEVHPISSNNRGPGDVTVPGTAARNSFQI